MKSGVDIDKSRLVKAMSACVENGQRLHEDAEWLGIDRSATVALCILAQEEFAKAFLLHLVLEGIIPWTKKVRGSLYKHHNKQLMGLIMEWLSPSDEEFDARMKKVPGDSILPAYVADAMKLFVEKVQPQGHISCPPAPSDPIAKRVAGGDRDKIKQDALYVRLSEDGDVISVPTQITSEMIEAELDRTKRLSYLVRPLRDGSIGPTVNYHILLEAMSFLLLDKNNRPFLILKEAGFGGPVSSPNGATWPHSVTVLIENITGEDATCVNGHAAVFLDNEITRPLFLLNEFAVEPYTAYLYTVLVSEETYTRGTDPSRTLSLFIDLEYRGVASDRKYHIRMWSTYDPSIGAFKETITDSRESVDVGDQARRDVETKWTRPPSS